MHQQKKDDETRDPYAALSGGEPPDDYPDWNNPEDQEDAPEGYYDEEEFDGEFEDGSYIPGPGDPDYDLSEQAGYAGWDDSRVGPLIPQWIIAAVSIILILSIAIPAIFLLR